MEPEGGAAVRLAVERNIPAHLFDQTLSDHQPERWCRRGGVKYWHRPDGRHGIAGTGRARGCRCRYRGSEFRSVPGITDGPLLHQYVDIAVLGKFDGVAHEVGHNLLQTQRIANDVIRYIVLNIQRQLQPFIVRGMRQQVTTSSSEVRSRNGILSGSASRLPAWKSRARH